MKNPSIVPLPGKTNSMLVYEQLEKLIADEYWKPEERILPEAELCHQFNVGRSTIREALNMLKAKNLIYTVPGIGSFVSKQEKIDASLVLTHIPDPKSEKDLLNIMELRLSLEPANAAFAARRAEAADIVEMEACQHALADSTSAITSTSGNPDMFAESDLAFHMLIAKATGNPVVMDVMNLVKAFLAEQQIVTSQQSSRRSLAVKFHDHILQAIRNRNAAGAESVMREHLEDTYAYVKSLVTISERHSGRFRSR